MRTNDLTDEEYRHGLSSAQVSIGIPFQIRALLKYRGKTVKWLVQKTGMGQPRISLLLSPGKTHPSTRTLLRIAKALDCGVAVEFVSFKELQRRIKKFDPEKFRVDPFKGE